ncbi:MAG: F0F1 ATP synthase subunit delta [Microbacteriaceae bacterium]
MGSATREALSASRTALSALGAKTDLSVGEELLAAGRVIGDSAQLRAALADPSAESAAKVSVVDAVFASLSGSARSLLSSAVSSRWSNDQDLLAGIEELGLRVIARSAGSAPIEAELFTFGTAVTSDPELELAVSSKLGSNAAKLALVQKLLGSKASPQTVAILGHLVQQPRGRRIAELLRNAATVVADEAGLSIATVTTAAPLGAAQLERLGKGLATTYGRELRINQVVDPELIGGVRVQIGDDVIDGSVASRLKELRLQLAG